MDNTSFILQFPEWNTENLFTHEVISFILLIIGIAAGLLLCFRGYRSLRALCIMLLGGLSGAGGIMLADKMTQNPVFQMSLFVIFTFFGVGFFYCLSILFTSILKALRIYTYLSDKVYIISAILGGLTVSLLTYTRIYRSIAAAIAIFTVPTVVGMIYQKKKAAERVIFHTYDDLCRMEPLKKGEAAGEDA